LRVKVKVFFCSVIDKAAKIKSEGEKSDLSKQQKEDFWIQQTEQQEDDGKKIFIASSGSSLKPKI